MMATFKRRDERGGAVLFFLIGLTMICLAGSALAYGGGRILADRERAFDVAEQAARAGAQEIDLGRLTETGATHLDPARARARASDFAALAGFPGATVGVTDDVVTVRVVLLLPPGPLRLLGIGSTEVRGEGRARPAVGVLQEEGSP